jgi:DnaJ homolog subfamily C member 7
LKIVFSQLCNIASNFRNLRVTGTFNPQSEEANLDDVISSVESMSFLSSSDLEKCRDKIGKFYEELNFDECLKQLNQALTIDKSCVSFLCLKAECLVMLERYEEAEKSITKALKKNPSDVNVLYTQGLKEYYEVKLKESVEKFDAVIKVFPDFKRAKELRANAKTLLNFIYTGFAQSKENNNAKAIEIFTSALKTDPSNKNFIFMMLFNRGIACDKVGQLKEAFDDYSEALKIKETDAKALYRRASIHYKLKEFEDCIIDCEAALKAEASEGPKKLIEVAKTSIKTAPSKAATRFWVSHRQQKAVKSRKHIESCLCSYIQTKLHPIPPRLTRKSSKENSAN